MTVFVRGFLATGLLLLGSCASPQVTDTTDLDGPVFGRKDETKFVAGSDGSPVGVGDLAKLAKTIRKYKNLGAGEQEIVRRVAQLKLDGLIATSMKRLEPQYERRREAVRQTTRKRTAAVRARSASLPPAAVAREVAAIESGAAAEIQKIDVAWKAAATAEVTKSYGTDFAIPVQNPEGKAVVAFASVRESTVSVSAAAYELDGSATQLATAAGRSQQVSHGNRSYALLNAQVDLQ